jgi:hypothetical protein
MLSILHCVEQFTPAFSSFLPLSGRGKCSWPPNWRPGPRVPKQYIWYAILGITFGTRSCTRAHIPRIPESCWCSVLITHKLSPQPILANYSQFMGSYSPIGIIWMQPGVGALIAQEGVLICLMFRPLGVERP